MLLCQNFRRLGNCWKKRIRFATLAKIRGPRKEAQNGEMIVRMPRHAVVPGINIRNVHNVTCSSLCLIHEQVIPQFHLHEHTNGEKQLVVLTSTNHEARKLVNFSTFAVTLYCLAERRRKGFAFLAFNYAFSAAQTQLDKVVLFYIVRAKAFIIPLHAATYQR